MKVVLAVAVAVGVFSGCSVPPTTGPVGGADGTFTITRTGETNYAQPSQLTAMATQDAQAHCLSMGKKSKVLRSKEMPTRPGSTPVGEVLYRCD